MIYVTGGNDDCIAVWDIGELGQKSSGKTETGNGKNDGLLVSGQLISPQRSW